jgi:hypothetical protein
LSPSFFIEAFPSHRALALAKTELPTGLWILIDSAWSPKENGSNLSQIKGEIGLDCHRTQTS